MTSQPKPTTEVYQLVYQCEKEDELGHVTVGAKGRKKTMSFKCEYCGQHLVPLAGKMELISHGHTQETVKHKLRKLKQTA
jgi:hypothetical protein